MAEAATTFMHAEICTHEEEFEKKNYGLIETCLKKVGE